MVGWRRWCATASTSSGATEVGGRDGEVGVAKLALQDVDRDAFAHELNRVAAAQLVGAMRRRIPQRRCSVRVGRWSALR